MAGFWVILPAAGIGSRMGADRPKQYLPLLGRPLISHTLQNVLSWPGLEGVVVATAVDDPYFGHLPESTHAKVSTVTGGAERADSVLAALDFLSGRLSDHTTVLVHDAARPCVSLKDIEALLSEDAGPVALLAQPASDTLKRAGVGENPEVQQTLDRQQVWMAQTPQRAPLGILRDALRAAISAGAPVTDESSALEFAGFTPRLIAGQRGNIKVTHPSDIPLAEAILRLQYSDAEAERQRVPGSESA